MYWNSDDEFFTINKNISSIVEAEEIYEKSTTRLLWI